MDKEDIDNVDYAILKCLEVNGGSWKKRVHEWVTDNMAELPEMKEVSLQTIGRRIDQLHDAGEVESCILSPDAVNRDMIIGYKLTPTGNELLVTKRREFIRDNVAEGSDILLTGEGDITLRREALIALTCDEFDIREETRENVLEKLETNEIISLLAVHHFLRNVDNTVNPDHEPLLLKLLTDVPQLGKPIAQDNIISRVRNALLNEQLQKESTTNAETVDTTPS